MKGKSKFAEELSIDLGQDQVIVNMLLGESDV